MIKPSIHLEQAVRLAPGSGRYGLLLGEAYLLRGETEAALAALSSAYPDTSTPRAAWLLGLALLALGRYAEAARFGKEALEIGCSFGGALEIRGWAAFAQSQWAEARRDFRRLLELSADHPRGPCGLAASIGFDYLQGSSSAPVSEIAGLLARKGRWELPAQEAALLEQLAGGARPDLSVAILKQHRERLVRGAAYALLRDLALSVRAMTGMRLAQGVGDTKAAPQEGE